MPALYDEYQRYLSSRQSVLTAECHDAPHIQPVTVPIFLESYQKTLEQSLASYTKMRDGCIKALVDYAGADPIQVMVFKNNISQNQVAIDQLTFALTALVSHQREDEGDSSWQKTLDEPALPGTVEAPQAASTST